MIVTLTCYFLPP